MKKFAPILILVAGILWGSMGLFVRTLNAQGLASMEIVGLRAAVTTRDEIGSLTADFNIMADRLEQKIHDLEDEATLKETVQAALAQIEEKQYATQLIARGIPEDHIRSYGCEFEGKKVMIGQLEK